MIHTKISLFIKVSISKLPKKFRMAPHNMIGHPCMELLHWVGLEKQAEWVHEVTIPHTLD